MRCLCTFATAFAVVSVFGTPSAAQEIQRIAAVATLGTLLAEAEAAFEAGDVIAAERAYAGVLVMDAAHPRALFRLAQLRRDEPYAALPLLQQYVGIEPSDAWGHLALADAFARAGWADDALRAYEEAFAREPDDRDIVLGRPRLLARLGRIDAAIDAYEAWVLHHPDDSEAWRELGLERQRAGRTRSASAAFQRALTVTPEDLGLSNRIDTLRIRRAPTLELGMINVGETGASMLGMSVTADFPGGDTGRVGISWQQRRVVSFDDVANARHLSVRASARPRAGLQLTTTGGVAWLTSGAATGSRARPDLSFRMRRTGAAQGTVVDMRAQHQPIDVTPELVRDPVFRTQVSTAVDVPIGGAWRVRGQGRVAALTRDLERNRRTGIGGGVAVAIAPDIRLSGQWHQTRHSNPAVAGYFAPRIAEVAEIGFELEREYTRATVAFDLGAGLQRLQKADASFGSSSPALRGWGLVGWNIGPRQQVLVEFETYDSQMGNAVTAAEHWRYVSVLASVRFLLAR